MGSEFIRKLHDFLEQEQISHDTHIVADIVYRLAGIEVKKEDNNAKFYSSNDSNHGYDSDDFDNSDAIPQQKIYFRLPHNQLNGTQLQALLTLFNISQDNYIVGSSLELNENFLVEHIFPKFQQAYQTFKETEVELMKRYRLESAHLLESTATETLVKYIRETLQILLAENLQELTPTSKSLFEFLSLLTTQVSILNQFPLFYKDILNGKVKVQEFLQNEEIKQSKTASRLQMIDYGIGLFARYHRNESRIALYAFFKELPIFLAPYRISSVNTDIVEHIILALADAQLKDGCTCVFKPGSDPSRLVLQFSDITEDNVRKILEFMRAQGDETATEGYGNKHHGSAVQLRAMSLQKSTKSFVQDRGARFYDTARPVKKNEPHSIEIDGKFLYDTLLPMIKAKILAMDANKELQQYQEPAPEAQPTQQISHLSMFQQQVPEEPAVSHGNEEKFDAQLS